MKLTGNGRFCLKMSHSHMLLKIIQFMKNVKIFETVLRDIGKSMILAKSQSPIFIIMLKICFFT